MNAKVKYRVGKSKLVQGVIFFLAFLITALSLVDVDDHSSIFGQAQIQLHAGF